MSITIRDEATAADLSAATEPQEVRASDDRLLGHFTPAAAAKMSFPEFGVTDEELEAEVQRLLTNPTIKWHTPEEVMAILRGIDRGLRS